MLQKCYNCYISIKIGEVIGNAFPWGDIMRGLFRKNKKVTIVLSMALCVIVIGIASVTSNASVNRQDEWMKKYLEYRAANKDLTNDQIAAMVDEEMSEISKQQEVKFNPGDMTKPTVTESPQSTTYPMVTNTPAVTQSPQQTLCPGDMTKPTVTESPQNTAYPVQQLVTTQTETPDAVVLPADIPALDETVKPGAREEEKKSTSPCDCEDCIAFYAIYQ